MPELLTSKYFPQTPKDFLGNSEIVQDCLKWGEKWVKGEKQKPILLFGDTGIGKTTLAILLAKYFEWQLFELNASDFRTKDIVEKLVGGALQNASLDGKKRLILLDEIDGIAGTEDKGGLQAVLKLVSEAQNPMILTANDVYADKKFAPLRENCIALQFHKINYLSIANHLIEICKNEKIEFEEEALRELAKNCNGDLRAALLDLQSMSFGEKISLNVVQNLSFREKEEDVFKTLNAIFHGKTFEEIQFARFKSDIDSDMLAKWIEENIPRQLQNSTDCALAFDRLSRADVFTGRILKRQDYSFLRYSSVLSTAGVGLAKTHSSHQWIKYEFPGIIRKLSGNKSARNIRKQIAEKIGKKTHSSSKAVISQDLPYLAQFLEAKENLPKLAAAFDLDEEELAFLIGSKPETKKVKEAIEKAKELKEKEIFAKRKLFNPISEEEMKRLEKKLQNENNETEKSAEKTIPKQEPLRKNIPKNPEIQKQTKLFG